VLASIELAKESRKGSKIVTVAVDTGLKYLWTEPYLKTSNAANSELASPRNNQTANDN